MYKVVHVGYFHKHDDIRIVEKESKTLASTGQYKVVYITSNRNCAMKDFKNDNVDIKVLNVSEKRFIRLLDYIKDVYEKIIEESPDICHIHEFVLFPLVRKLKKRGVRIVLDLHENDVEDRSEQMMKHFGNFIGKIAHILLVLYEKRVIKLSDGVISVTPQIISRVEKYGIPVKLIPNYPLLSESTEIRSKNDFNESRGTMCFAGGVSDLWSHEAILSALNGIDDVKYLLAGRSDEEYLNTLKKHPSWGKVQYYGVISHDKVINTVYRNAMIGMALMEYDDGWIGTTGTMGNTKIFEFMQNGLPVICTNFSLWDDIVGKNKCGILVNPNDISAIKDAIIFLTNNPDIAYNMGCRGRQLVFDKYNWDNIKSELILLYDQITHQEVN